MTTTGAASAITPTSAPDPTAPSAAARRGWAAAVDYTLLACGVAALALVLPHEFGGDGAERVKALNQLLTGNGFSTNAYSLIGPIFAAPLWAVDTDLLLFYNLLIFLLGVTATYLWLRKRVDPVLLRRTGLILVGASILAPALANFYGETFTMTGMGLGIVAAVRRGDQRADKIARVLGWTAAVLGAANSPATLPALALAAGLWALWRRRLRYAVPVLAAGILMIAEKWIRYGSPTADPYAGSNHIAKTVMPYSGHGGFSYPIFFGILAILFSFGKGLVWYLPGLLLPVRRRLTAISPELRDAYVLWLCQLGVLVLVYAGWWSWYGGLYWGPRFFLLGILPASLALAVSLADRSAGLLKNMTVLGVTTLSCWVGLAAVVYPGYPGTCVANYYQLEFVCHYTPEFSALWRPFVVAPELHGGQLAVVAYSVILWVWLAGPLVYRSMEQAADRVAQIRGVTAGWRW
jgi:hypothetical protein